MTPAEILDMDTLIEEQFSLAREATSGRSAITIVGDHTLDLRQTLVAIMAGERMRDHDSPGEATLHMLRGKASISTEDRTIELVEDDYVKIPPERHGLEAITDCAFLLTVATRGERPA